tara:strand:- start:23543 stop:24583 length:1041 start_codon:yes stop_codon:yes gene_type:complete
MKRKKLMIDKSMENENTLKISVIMPVYNGVTYIKQSLPPLIAMLNRQEICEVIVVDDSSEDETIAVAEKLGAKVISSGGRLGPGGARNKAAEYALGKLLWFVDADVVVHDDAAEKISPNFHNESVVAIFGTYDDNPAADNFLSQYKNLVHHFYHLNSKKEASTFWSGCGVIRKANFIAQNGFDVATYSRPSIEDIELGYRLISAGGKILLVKDFLSTHLKEWRFLNLIHTEIFCRAIPWSRLMLRKTGLINDLNVGVGERISAVIAGLFFLSVLNTTITGLSSSLIGVFFILSYFSNRKLYNLFYRRKGSIFMFGGMLYHQFYYAYSSAAFMFCYLEKKLLAHHQK